MTTAIVTIPIDYANTLDVIKEIKGQTYKTTTALRIHLAMVLKAPEGDDGDGIEDVEIYNLEDFGDAMNECKVNDAGTYMTHVYFEN